MKLALQHLVFRPRFASASLATALALIACGADPDSTTDVVLDVATDELGQPLRLGEVAPSEVVLDARSVPFRRGRVLVQFTDGATAADKKAARASVGGSLLEDLEGKGTASSARRGLELLQVDSDDGGVERALATLRSRRGVAYAEADWIYTHSAAPTDPGFGQLWGLNNTGQRINNRAAGTVDVDMDLPEALDIVTDANNLVFVGIIDEGIDFKHNDLAGLIINPGEDSNGDGRITQDDIDGVDNDDNGVVDDVHGFDFANRDNTVYDGTAGDNVTDSHGTHVAGTIGARQNNNVGIAGIATNVRMISGKFLGANGGATSDAVKAIDYLTDLKGRGVNIVATNNSWGGGGFSRTLQDAIERANRAGILFIAAAGNGGADGVGDNNDNVASFPGNMPNANVISVASIDRAGRLSRFSNFGIAQVDVAAPGSAILSTTPNNTFSFFDGTSMACPHVTGLAALLASKKNLTAAEIKARILNTVVKTSALNGKVATGGRVNAFRALQSSTASDP